LIEENGEEALSREDEAEETKAEMESKRLKYLKKLLSNSSLWLSQESFLPGVRMKIR